MKKCGLILIMMALMTTITSAQQLWDPDGVTPFETFAAVKEKIQAFSYQKIDNKKLEEAAISGMLKSLNDPYCRFMGPDQYDLFKLRQSGSLDGFGLQMGIRDGKLVVIAPIQGSAAQKAGISPLDTILTLNDRSALNMGLDEAMSLIQDGPILRVRIRRESTQKILDFTLKRSKMPLKAVTDVREFGSVGYIRLATFESQSTTGELSSALMSLKKPYIRAIVLDLRNNGGGLVNQAAGVLGLFIQEADALYTVSRDGQKRPLHISGAAPYRGPLVILLNHGSASSSEIVAGALKDLKRAVIVGEKSFGKASVQKVIELPNGSALILTVAHYLTPNGVDISKLGITPDYPITDTRSGNRDLLLEEAVNIATEQGYKQK